MLINVLTNRNYHVKQQIYLQKKFGNVYTDRNVIPERISFRNTTLESQINTI